MNVEIKIPQMGESVSEATISAIMKGSGSFVKLDEPLLELETEKVNQVLYASKEGVVQLQAKVGDVVTIGQIIGFIEAGAAPSISSSQQPLKEVKEEKPQRQEIKEELPLKSGASLRVSVGEGLHDLLTPTSAVTSNVIQHAKNDVVESSSCPAREERKKMTRLRSTIARRLVEAKQTTAMLTTFNEVDMQPIMDARARFQESFSKKYGIKLGFMSFFVKACVQALEELPLVQAYIEGDEIIYRHYYDIGIAVGGEKGLVVPVVRNCDHLSFAEVEKQISDYATKARSNGLKMEDLQGAGFTITNGGIYGSLLSTPILNPPQSAILGMHKIQKRVVVVNDEMVIRPMMYLALSYDHRIIDGKEAVTFLVKVKESLEDPMKMLLGV